MYSTRIRTNPDIYEIKVPFNNVSTSDTNCYVVKDGADALIVDTGAPTEDGYAILRDALEELGADPSKASYFLTHLHYDHVGLMDRIASAGATVYLSAEGLGMARDGGTAELHEDFRRLAEEGVPRTEADALVRSVTGPRVIDIDRCAPVVVGDGDVVDVGSYRLQVVATPGHTPDHLSLYEPGSKTLFGGDHVLFVISPGITVFPDGSDSLQAYLNSLDRVRNMEIDALLVSHGENRPDFRERIDWLKRHHIERLDETVGIVEREPGLTGEDVVRRIHWNVPSGIWSEISLMQRWCILMEGIAILDHLTATGRVKRAKDGDARNVYFPVATSS